MKKRILSLLMTAILTVAMVCPVMADTGTWTGQDNGYGGTFTSGTGGPGTSQGKTKVTAEVGSTYTVVLPSTLTLSPDPTAAIGGTASSTNYAAKGVVQCYGNVASDRVITVSIPHAYNLTGAAAVTGAAEFEGGNTGGVNSESYLMFAKNAVASNGETEVGANSSDTTNGKGNVIVSADLVTAGGYTGDLAVTFGIDNRTP